MVVLSSSCNIDEEITTSLPPKIILDNEKGVYSLKIGREVVIAPSYESAEGAQYRWTMDGEVIGTRPSLTFYGEEIGEYYIYISVTTDAGSDEEEIKIEVTELEIPTVTIASNKQQSVAVGTTLQFAASVRETTLPTTVAWSLNDTTVGEGTTYTFNATEVGEYTITATATNEDGSFSDTVRVEVLNAEDMPFIWEFEREAYHTVVGRKLRITPKATSNEEGVTYTWYIDGQEGVASNTESLTFVNESAGEYHITATATAMRDGSQITLTREFTVTLYEEGAFYRAIDGSSKSDWNRVLEYTPAPGQFINETKTGGFDGTQTTPEAAIAYAEARMSEVDSNGNPNPTFLVVRVV